MIGRRVDVYMNLNRDCYSVKDMDPGSNDYGTVIDHVDAAVIDDPDFVVQPAGLARARESGVRNVHAFVRGTLDAVDDDAKMGSRTAWAFSYRPFDQNFIESEKPFIYDGYLCGRPAEKMPDPEKVYVGDIGSYALYDTLPDR